MPLWLFIFLAVLSVIGAAGVILQRHPVHSLLSLVMTLIMIAVLFIGLGATTVGFLQIIVYAGAIMVLFLFVIWLLNLQSQPIEPGRLALKFLGSLGSAALIAELLLFVIHPPAALAHHRTVPVDFGSIGMLAESLFTDYLIAFEATSVLLLVGVVGGVALARRTTASAGAPEEVPDDAAKLLHGPQRRPVLYRRGGSFDPPQRDHHLHVNRVDAKRGQPGVRRRQPRLGVNRRAVDRLFRNDRRGGRGRSWSGNHPFDLPQSRHRQRRRIQPDAVVARWRKVFPSD
jgi:NADH-quinone oxidoreductase subunit J